MMTAFLERLAELDQWPLLMIVALRVRQSRH
jgi:hypothetical protein